MTIIVADAVYTSKSQLKTGLDSGAVWIYEPSIVESWRKLSSELPIGFYATCTNAKRSKFCIIQKLSENNWIVK